MHTTTTTTAPTRVTIDPAVNPETPNPWDNAPAMTVTEFGPTWNGFACPAVTADTFRQWVTAMKAHDTAGPWNPDGIREAWLNGDGNIVDQMPGDEDLAAWPVLVYDRGDGQDPDVWPAAAASDTPDQIPTILGDDDFNTLYPLDGWTWTTLAD